MGYDMPPIMSGIGIPTSPIFGSPHQFLAERGNKLWDESMISDEQSVISSLPGNTYDLPPVASSKGIGFPLLFLSGYAKIVAAKTIPASIVTTTFPSSILVEAGIMKNRTPRI
jgi:hypothetical protein